MSHFVPVSPDTYTNREIPAIRFNDCLVDLNTIPPGKYIFVEYSTAWKTIFSFSKCPEKMVFPKMLHWNMIFVVFSGNMIFLLPKNIILFFKRKVKDDSSQKDTWKYDIFFGRKIKHDLSQEIHGNVRKSSNNSLYFYGALHSRSLHILLCSEKTRKPNM